MATITYFQQQRKDGGVRSGIDLDGDTVLSRFKAGASQSDPALLWYVDVKCAGPRMPRTAETARQWLLGNERVIVRLLASLADDVPAGIDPTAWPIRKTARSNGTKVEVACSAMRRVTAQQIARILKNVGRHWRQSLDALATAEVG